MTGPDGRATARFETAADTEQDHEYMIEARVIDLSRREIVGAETVRVTRRGYFVHPRAERNVVEPGGRSRST